jgi:hypothetical protein
MSDPVKDFMKVRRRFAQLVATTVSVICSRCGEPQPSPGNGSDNWTPEEVRAVAATSDATRDCVSCNAPMLVTMQPMARISE